MKRFSLLLVFALTVVSCATAKPVGSAVSPSPSPVGAVPSASGPSATTAATATSGAARAAFLTTPLTDVRTGQQFTLSDFGGKQVIVQGMAVW